MLSDHPTPEAAGPLLDRFVDLHFDTAGLPTFATRDADGRDTGSLELPEGRARAAFRLVETRAVPGEGIHYTVVETRVADAAGRWWAATTFLDTDAFCLPILPRDDDSVHQGISYWQKAPDDLRRTLLAGCDVVDAGGLLDSRERYRLRVGGEWATVMLKYQGPSVDAAWIEGTDQFYVRLKQMVIEEWEPDVFETPPDQEPELRQIIDNVTLCFRMPATDLLLFTAPYFHWTEWQQWYEVEDLEERRPVFEPSEEPGSAS